MNEHTRHNFGTFFRILVARLRFVAVFVFAAALIGYWDSIKNHLDKWTHPAVAHVDENSAKYTCPMHPSIIRNEPGNCPLCGMPLELLKQQNNTPGRLQLTPYRIAQAGIETSLVQYKSLSREIRVVGTIDYDETKLAQLSTRVAGRVDELFVRSVGSQIKKGDPIYSLYSPEVFTAQREYLLARQNARNAAKDAAGHADASDVYNASMQKLVLWGFTQDQLDRLDAEFDRTGKVPTHFTVTSPINGIVIKKDVNEGAYLQMGETPFTVADLSGVWLQARLFENDFPLVVVGQSVAVSVDAIPGETFNGRVDFLAYQLDPQTRTVSARIGMKNPDLKLRPGMYAAARISVAVATTQPSTGAPLQNQMPSEAAAAFSEAFKHYDAARTHLAGDNTDAVMESLQQTIVALSPIDAGHHDALVKMQGAIKDVDSANLEMIREHFKAFSAAMIDLGQSVGISEATGTVQVFRCPMVKSNWLQSAGPTVNPYMGSKMLDCGGPVATLPRSMRSHAPASQPTEVSGSGKVLAVPRSAVIETGQRQVVFVQSSPGVFDLREVKLGALAGDDYPVVSGLNEGEAIVTRGAFLIDAENLIHPAH